MKMANWMIAVLAAGMFAAGGCNRTPAPPKVTNVNGVAVAMPELVQSLNTNTAPEIRQSITKMAYGLRYRDMPSVLAELDKLASSPALTDAQKKLVAEVTEQVKQAQSKAPANP
jgi:hypothetical protein